MKFQRDERYDDLFSQVPNARFYPYVGKNFDSQEKRVMVFAHNIAVPSDRYEQEQARTSSKTHFADALDEFTYEKGWWTKTWQNFIKASIGLKSNYSINSDPKTIDRIDNFVQSICCINYINDLVKAEQPVNAQIPKDLINKSNEVNYRFLDILNITHCVCWGKDVFNYLGNSNNFRVIEGSGYNKKGFGYMKVENVNNGKRMHVLKIFHPSMPGFGHFNDDTQEILRSFYSLD
jgi:hypothetical protein